jgi:DNA-binding GntR family transcriptional regulator
MKLTLESPETGSSPFDMLLAAVERGDLAPGARLREAELASKFGISRTPVREALLRLQTMGLAVPGPQRGLVVAELSYTQLRQLFSVRERLEGMAAHFAALNALPEEIEVLQDMVERDAGIVDGNLLRDRNKVFHRQIYRASHNAYLVEILENLRIHLSLLRGSTYNSSDRIASAQAEHRDIVKAIAARDAEAAEKAARNHIVNGYRVRIAQVSNGLTG